MEDRKTSRGKRHVENKSLAQYHSPSTNQLIKKGAKTNENQDRAVNSAIDILRSAGFDDITVVAKADLKKSGSTSKAKKSKLDTELDRAYLQGVGWALGILGSYSGMGEPETAQMILNLWWDLAHFSLRSHLSCMEEGIYSYADGMHRTRVTHLRGGELIQECDEVI